jgi:hypothetical protein
MHELTLGNGVLAFDGRVFEVFSSQGLKTRAHVGVIDGIDVKQMGKGKSVLNIRYRGGGHELLAFQIADSELPAVAELVQTVLSARKAWPLSP